VLAKTTLVGDRVTARFVQHLFCSSPESLRANSADNAVFRQLDWVGLKVKVMGQDERVATLVLQALVCETEVAWSS